MSDSVKKLVLLIGAFLFLLFGNPCGGVTLKESMDGAATQAAAGKATADALHGDVK